MFDPLSYTVTEGNSMNFPLVCVTILGVAPEGTEADVIVTLTSMDGVKTGIKISAVGLL